jgi:DNA-binding transcriptional regulator LsrR (DeoR family)
MIARQVDRDNEIARMYFVEHMKTAQIAKKVKLDSSQVSRIVYNMKQTAMEISRKIEEVVPHGTTPINMLTLDEQMLAAFNSVDSNGRTRKRSQKKVVKDNKSNNPALLKEMQLFFEENGFYHSTSQEVRNYLLTKLPEQQVPSTVTLRKIMQDKFNLKYSRVEKANAKYRDPSYNEKRLWISRLVARFIAEDVIIISVDESNFRHDALPNK